VKIGWIKREEKKNMPEYVPVMLLLLQLIDDDMTASHVRLNLHLSSPAETNHVDDVSGHGRLHRESGGQTGL